MSTATDVFSADNDHVGPVGADLIGRGVVAGKVPNDAFVAPLGSTQWVSLANVPELNLAVSVARIANSSVAPNAAAAKPGEKKLAPLDPRYKFLPLAIFGGFAFIGVIETTIALIVMK